MAPRIPVVFSQAAGLTPQARDHEESLIAELLMEDRSEVSLIGAMEQLEEEDTDRLCLLGFQGDFVLLTSLDSEQVFRELERLQIEGRQGRTMFEPTGDLRAEQNRRRIYHISVAAQGRQQVRQEVRRLREDAKIATIPLMGLDGATAISSPPPNPGIEANTAKRRPVETRPVEIKAQTKPADTKPLAAEQKAAEQKAAEQKPVEDKVGENGAGEGHTGEEKVPGPSVTRRSSSHLSSPRDVSPGFDQWDDDEIDSQLDSLVDELDDMDL